MEKIFAEFNHGRWIAICPRCQAVGIIAALDVKPGDFFVCPEEYPNIVATMLVPHPRVKGAFNAVPDPELRLKTRSMAFQQNGAYEIVFPEDAAEIVTTLRVRPVHARNWQPGTTLEELQNENKTYGVGHA